MLVTKQASVPKLADVHLLVLVTLQVLYQKQLDVGKSAVFGTSCSVPKLADVQNYKIWYKTSSFVPTLSDVHKNSRFWYIARFGAFASFGTLQIFTSKSSRCTKHLLDLVKTSRCTKISGCTRQSTKTCRCTSADVPKTADVQNYKFSNICRFWYIKTSFGTKTAGFDTSSRFWYICSFADKKISSCTSANALQFWYLTSAMCTKTSRCTKI